MPLTDTAIKHSKPGEKPIKLTDGGGLYLYVDPKGSKLWRMNFTFLGKQGTLSFGKYPEVSLATARKKRDDAKTLIAAGTNPSQAAKEAKILRKTSAENTFATIADELVAKNKREGKADATLTKRRWLLDIACASIGTRPVTEISAVEVLDALRKVESAGNYETARRLRSNISMVFRFAIATGRATNDPTFGLRGALTSPVVTHRAALTGRKEFGALLRAIWAYDGQATTRAGLMLMALLFPRPGELRQRHVA